VIIVTLSLAVCWWIRHKTGWKGLPSCIQVAARRNQSFTDGRFVLSFAV
jgi:hypothetical protein